MLDHQHHDVQWLSVPLAVFLFFFKMDPIVSLHYYAPVCATINACIIPFTEGFAPFREIGRIGFFVLFTNAGIAFALNVSLMLHRAVLIKNDES